jgi:hypothetical protein
MWMSEEKGRNDCRMTTGLSSSEQNACHAGFCQAWRCRAASGMGAADVVRESTHPALAGVRLLEQMSGYSPQQYVQRKHIIYAKRVVGK